jgi:hypothetical protein
MSKKSPILQKTIISEKLPKAIFRIERLTAHGSRLTAHGSLYQLVKNRVNYPIAYSYSPSVFILIILEKRRQYHTTAFL